MTGECDLLRLPAVEFKTGLSGSSIYVGVKKKTFPEPVSIGPRAIAWRSDEIQEWIDSRPRLDDAARPWIEKQADHLVAARAARQEKKKARKRRATAVDAA